MKGILLNEIQKKQNWQMKKLLVGLESNLMNFGFVNYQYGNMHIIFGLCLRLMQTNQINVLLCWLQIFPHVLALLTLGYHSLLNPFGLCFGFIEAHKHWFVVIVKVASVSKCFGFIHYE
jgi:hypothetical protein